MTVPQHFTAWLATDRAVLLGDHADVTILQDEAISYRTDDEGNEIPAWTTAPGVPQAFYAETTATDHDDAQDQARELMEAAGWRIVGGWKPIDTGYVVTVERTEDLP